MVKARDASSRATRGSLVVDADCAPPRRGPVGLEAAAEDAVLEERELGRVARPAVRPDPLPEVACVRRSYVVKAHRFDAARTNAPAHVVVAQREAVREERDLRGGERRLRRGVLDAAAVRRAARVHALPVLLELAHDLRDDVTERNFAGTLRSAEPPTDRTPSPLSFNRSNAASSRASSAKDSRLSSSSQPGAAAIW